jgi:hypothetical protein
MNFSLFMPGVRRAGVTAAIGLFHPQGMIQTSRGGMVIRDRDGFEKCANGLYGIPEVEFERLFASGSRNTLNGDATLVA